MNLRSLILGMTLSTVASLALAASDGPVLSDAGILVDGNGMTLYVFDKDEPGTSNCYDNCANNWPPFVADAGAAAEGDLTLVERNDGQRQWALDGMPLYYWAGDHAPGDMTGDGVGRVWHAIRQ